MLPSRAPPPKRTPLKVSTPAPATPTERKKLNVPGVAAALRLTESQVRMRVHRKQWELIPEPEETRDIGARYFWYADNVAAFKIARPRRR